MYALTRAKRVCDVDSEDGVRGGDGVVKVGDGKSPVSDLLESSLGLSLAILKD